MEQGRGVFKIQTGNGSMYKGVTQSGVAKIVGSKGETFNCVTSIGVTKIH